MTEPARRSARTCIFCGDHANSKEHALGKWVLDVLSATDLEGVPGRRHVVTLDSEGAPYLVDRGPGSLGVSEVPIRVVCVGCNNGWMSKLEASTKALVEQLLKGPAELTSGQAMDLDRWILKVGAVWEWNYPDAVVVPQSQRDALLEGLPVPGSASWVAVREIPSSPEDTAHSMGTVSTSVTVEGLEGSRTALIVNVQVGPLMAVGLLADTDVYELVRERIEQVLEGRAAPIEEAACLAGVDGRLSESDAHSLFKDVFEVLGTREEADARRALLGDVADWYYQ